MDIFSTNLFRIVANNQSRQYRSISKNNVGCSKIYYSILQYCGFHFSVIILLIVILASRGRSGLFFAYFNPIDAWEKPPVEKQADFPQRRLQKSNYGKCHT